MNNLLRATSVAVSLGAALALSGCGGGGGTAMPEPMPPPPVPPLAESLASTDAQFTPLTAAYRSDWTTNPRSVALTDDFHVTSISSDGADGWHVTYVQDGVEKTVRFEKGAFADRTGGSPGSFYAENDDGDEFWFWSQHSHDMDRGTEPRFTYYDQIDATANTAENVDDRYFLVYGNLTNSASLPAGTALYIGGLYSRSQLKDNPRQSARLDIHGNLRLVADFVAGTLEGGISGIRFRRYDESGNRGSWEDIPETNQFMFENGRLSGGRLMAEVTGMDSGNNALDDTVQGFEGKVDGEFYGPAAEEMAAVVSAESTAHNRVLIGRIDGKRLNPQTFEGERVPLSRGVERDYPASQVELTETATVTAIEGDGAGGFHVTYRVDGVDQRVHLEASDYDSEPNVPYIYASEGENSPYVLFDMSDSFAVFRSPEFDHFNANGWVVVAYDANGDPENVRRGLMVYGDRTEVADLPAGTASYDGRVYAFGYPSDNPRGNARSGMRGSLALMADFASSAVSGRIHGIQSRRTPSSQFEDVTGELAISDGAISGNGFTADLAGQLAPGSFDGEMSGQFFGPAAAEVGGVLSGEYTEPGETIVVHGFFGGKKQ